jgi:benzil reductase ((S)-benzoin forming)
VPGTSRGLGAALAAQLTGPGHTVLGLARRANDTLSARGGVLEQWAADLADPAPVAARLEAWLAAFDGARFDSASLVNNAGVLSRIGPIDETDSADLANALRVGLEAPLLLTAAFLRATRTWPGRRRVLNISSGLGRRPMAGSASYCAAKAGLDLFTRSTALDEAERPNGARLVSLAPGVIDTDMQVQLRGSDPTGCPDRERFVGLKANGQLVTAEDTAARVLALLHRDDFGAEPLADVRD